MEDNAIKAVTAEVTAVINNLPIGTVMPYMGVSETLPGLRNQGWLLCDGKDYETNREADLFNAIKFSCGGSGSTFHVPDLRGMFLRGVNGDGNADPDAGGRTEQRAGGHTGNNVGSKQGHAFARHSHKIHEWNTSSFKITHHNDNWHPPCEIKHLPSEEVGGNETRPVNVYVYYIIFAGLPK